MSAGENRKREKLEHGQARDDKFRHLLCDTHGWFITTKTHCPPARGWTGCVGKDRVPLLSAWLGTVLIQQ